MTRNGFPGSQEVAKNGVSIHFVETAKVTTYYEHKLHNGERIAKDMSKVTP